MYNEKYWSQCRRCPLHKTRISVVQYGGQIPAQVLFVGEAPGRSEDCWGEPFIGPAGDYLKLLIGIVKDHIDFTYAITNTICCIPKTEDGDIRIPTPEEIQACTPRFIQFLNYCSPSLVVLLGKICQQHWDSLTKEYDIDCETCRIRHPSYIMQSPRDSHGWRLHDAAATVITALEMVDGKKRLEKLKE